MIKTQIETKPIALAHLQQDELKQRVELEAMLKGSSSGQGQQTKEKIAATLSAIKKISNDLAPMNASYADGRGILERFYTRQQAVKDKRTAHANIELKPENVKALADATQELAKAE